MSNVTYIEDWLAAKDEAHWDRLARSEGFATWRDLENWVVEEQHQEMVNDPAYWQHVRESRIQRGLERARKRP
jgi:hypothetical protein